MGRDRSEFEVKSRFKSRSDPEPEHWLLRWALWSMLFALAIGGRPWKFPHEGRLWVEERLFERESQRAR